MKYNLNLKREMMEINESNRKAYDHLLHAYGHEVFQSCWCRTMTTGVDSAIDFFKGQKMFDHAACVVDMKNIVEPDLEFKMITTITVVLDDYTYDIYPTKYGTFNVILN